MLKQIKVMGIAVIIGLSLNLIGCESTQDTTTNDENLKTVKQYVQEVVKESGIKEFEVKIDGDNIVELIYHQEEDTKELIKKGEWDEIVEDVLTASNSIVDAIEYMEIENINFEYKIIENGKTTLRTRNRQVVYNENDFINLETDTEVNNIEEVATIEERNALKKAQSYINNTDFSEQDLRRQLEYHEFSEDAIIYALENVTVDYQKECIEQAESYLSHNAFSEQDLRRQLEYHGYNTEHIEKAIQETYK